ncbi:hypothetical protein HQK29_02685 [Vibrio vulnificus]|nr:hypothetical protein [Vibrio vulnificus]
MHPPLLYLGYVGFASILALGVAALLQPSAIHHWFQAGRDWAMVAWGFLTLGIIVGSGGHTMNRLGRLVVLGSS